MFASSSTEIYFMCRREDTTHLKSVLKERIQLNFPKIELCKFATHPDGSRAFLLPNGHFSIMRVKKMEERFSKLRPIILGRTVHQSS
jgi:hypothetical protein